MEGDDARRIARHLLVDGRVQGVYFRSATRQVAQRCGVAGWVRNRPDGRVEAWLEGRPDDVETVEAWIHAGGPPAAEVTEVEVMPAEPSGHEGFVIRPS